jgi:thymidylate synthase ThyX
MTRYTIKLRGTNCYIKNTTDNAINFTTDSKKAKVFEYHQKSDIIDKLLAKAYKHKGERHGSDHIRLTMDKDTWQKLYYKHLDQIQDLSDCRLAIHQFSTSLVKKFEAKAIAYSKTGEFPNFNCEYYGEDFEREAI